MVISAKSWSPVRKNMFLTKAEFWQSTHRVNWTKGEMGERSTSCLTAVRLPVLNTPDSHDMHLAWRWRCIFTFDNWVPDRLCNSHVKLYILVRSGKNAPSVVSWSGSKGLFFHFSCLSVVVINSVSYRLFYSLYETFLLSLPSFTLKDLLSF